MACITWRKVSTHIASRFALMGIESIPVGVNDCSDETIYQSFFLSLLNFANCRHVKAFKSNDVAAFNATLCSFCS